MKLFFIALGVFMSSQLVAQTDYYTKKGVAIDGYDVVSYFDGSPKKGLEVYASVHDGVQFYFLTEYNKEKFEANPTKFVPQYGGYCAYAIGVKAEKVKIDPETYEIRDGKLYLFYNSWGINTLDLWNDEGAAQLQAKADENWKKMIQK